MKVLVNGVQQSLYTHGETVQLWELDSYHAWQYFTGQDNVAFENLPNSNPIFRMRFDEMIAVLPNGVNAGDKIRIEKESNDNNAYTIDFIELEQADEITFDAVSGVEGTDKFRFEGNAEDLQNFINEHPGKIIYLPKGKYDFPKRLYLTNGATLQGAGLFYTEIYFTAELTNNTYNKRGVEANVKAELHDVYLNTVLNQRYYQRNDGKQPGKGLNGSWGTGSKVSGVLVQHFECGAWIDGAKELTVTNCRFRNNYADGTNMCSGSQNITVSHCHYRNNGDDDMASWSATYQAGAPICKNVVYEYNTSECNWRASGIGFFGGEDHKAQNCLVADAIESGLRAVATFPGYAFSTNGSIDFENISVYHCGGKQSTWNGKSSAVVIDVSNPQYNINNIHMKNIDIYDSKTEGLLLDAYNAGSRKLNGICLEQININGYNTLNGGYRGFSVAQSSTKGSVNYYDIVIDGKNTNGMSKAEMNTAGMYNAAENNSAFTFCNAQCGETCSTGIFDTHEEAMFQVKTCGKDILVSNAKGLVRLTNALGQKVCEMQADENGNATFACMESGFYIVSENNNATKIILE